MGGCDVISVQRVDPDRVTKYGYTALEISAINGRTEIVRLLVREHGANVNKMNDNNQFTPLENAIEGGHMDTVRMMIEEARTVRGSTERRWYRLSQLLPHTTRTRTMEMRMLHLLQVAE